MWFSSCWELSFPGHESNCLKTEAIVYASEAKYTVAMWLWHFSAWRCCSLVPWLSHTQTKDQERNVTGRENVMRVGTQNCKLYMPVCVVLVWESCSWQQQRTSEKTSTFVQHLEHHLRTPHCNHQNICEGVPTTVFQGSVWRKSLGRGHSPYASGTINIPLVIIVHYDIQEVCKVAD